MGKKSLILLIILLLPIISSQSISVNYSQQVPVEEEFIFILDLIGFPEDLYDVKIDLVAYGERIAKIKDSDTWKSTYYYVNDAIMPSDKQLFLLKVEDYVGIASITIKIRDPSKNVETFEGYEIEVTQRDFEGLDIDENATREVENFLNQIGQNQTQEPDEDFSETEPLNPPIELISLNPQVIKSGDETKRLEKSDYALYGFLFFCILLLILLLIKVRKNERNKRS